MVSLRWENTSRRKEIFRGESVYYFRNYWNRVGLEFSSGFRHQYWYDSDQLVVWCNVNEFIFVFFHRNIYNIKKGKTKHGQ